MRIQACTPVIMVDGRILCYSCYQEDDTAKLDMWMPKDRENYPQECDNCGLIMERPI